MSKAKSILDIIRHRHRFKWIYNYRGSVDYEEPGEPEIATRKLSADDWQEFKRKFVEEYGGEPVEVTGMTNNELLKYIKTSGYRENSEFDQSTRLRQILQAMDQDDLD
jgi:hypothetical protein